MFVTNDNEAMHVVSAFGVPTVAAFGATRHQTTGPTEDRAVVVRQAVTPARVVEEAFKIVG